MVVECEPTIPVVPGPFKALDPVDSPPAIRATLDGCPGTIARPIASTWSSFSVPAGTFSFWSRTAAPHSRGKFTFQDPEKIRELARRGEAMGTANAREELEREIQNGRGGVYLYLTPEEYRRLR
jgi:hypothetical protein